MPEENQDPRPVSALLYPTKGLLTRAKAAGEVDQLLGGVDGDRLRSVCKRGQFVRRRLPGAEVLGELFFDWEETGSKFGTLAGRLKSQAAIKGHIAEGASTHAPEILLGCDEFRAAVSK